jgi:hypothetical protein
MDKINSKEEQYKRLLELISEKRSDIADVLEAIEAGRPWDDDWIEHRFITATLQDKTEVQYDTLTTEISYLPANEEEWKKAEAHKYED